MHHLYIVYKILIENVNFVKNNYSNLLFESFQESPASIFQEFEECPTSDEVYLCKEVG